MPRDYIAEKRPDFDAMMEHLRMELSSIRTGRANPAILDVVKVEAYGVMNPIVNVASVTVPDARTIVVEPWDKSVVKDIERAIIEANIGINPVVAGTVIRLPVPSLTEDSRKLLVKGMHEKLEYARIKVRAIRDDVRHQVIEDEKAGEISEDEKYRILDDLDKISAGWNEKIKHMGEEKEKEIMTV